MSKNTSIILGAHLLGFVEAQVSAGRFSSASEVVRAGLRLLEAHELKLQALRDALAEGEASGPAEPLDLDAYLVAKRASRGA
ncbi:type II toxin-antitoxin system ParD family antitoxin [Amaricoccus sp.]|uniref:type II toxin-antitoxin system ParD family antitoxin n=1 Tax=Amaricoccus sp. TaxID=1872485 RepID=UPI001B3D97BA|nr:type II toxin-antitoxin system ParD family antitoxin [Amaricoccus sp.]MBP7241927.1 type II toxin-antitoxin system ParD family antitoxin [Amaricoccus sp.]